MVNDPHSLNAQKQLNAFYLRELASPVDCATVPSRDEYDAIDTLEREWNAVEESLIDPARKLRPGEDFREWYKRLHREHREELEAFFEYMATQASAEEIAFYVCMEEQVDGKFDDVIALSQLGLSGDAKLALAENYWDEMGNGAVADMHTVLFEKSAVHMREILSRAGIDVGALVPSAALRNGNILMLYALRRRYALRLLGAVSILEHTAPRRFQKTAQGMRRLGFAEDAVYYHEMHVAVDAKHGDDLFRRVLGPIVEQNPAAAEEIAMGALIRYQTAMAYYRALQGAMLQSQLRRGA